MPFRRRTPLLGLTLAVALGAGWLTGCSASDDDPTAGTSDEPTSTTVAESTTTSPGSTGDVTSTTEVTGRVEIVLRGDGLGVVELGADPDAAVAALSEALGEPTVDTGWEASFSRYGTCPGEMIRGVEWDFLVVLFTDGDTSYGSGEHLFSWRVTGSPPPIATARGFGYQATVADAEELYPGAVDAVPAEEPFPAFLEVEVEGGPIVAFLDEQDRVTNLEAGVPCGE